MLKKINFGDAINFIGYAALVCVVVSLVWVIPEQIDEMRQIDHKIQFIAARVSSACPILKAL